MKSFIEQKSFDFHGQPTDILGLFQGDPFLFLLESSLHKRSMGRYSFIGFDPFDVVKCRGRNAIDHLRQKFLQYFKDLVHERVAETPFPAGMMGYLSYDFGLPLEKTKRKNKKESGIPDILFGFYDSIITIDHFDRKIIITSTGFPERRSALRRKKAKERLRQIATKISGSAGTKLPPGATAWGLVNKKLLPGAVSWDLSETKQRDGRITLRSNFTKNEYLKAVRKALDYISRGDIYQVNLSQQFCLDRTCAPSSKDSLELYRLLRDLSPSCFGAYFDCGKFQIASSSPERFLQLRERVVQTRPMKGTRPRGRTKEEDEKQRKELLASCKDKAELLMITDLERNDLGRACSPGSIHVKEMRSLEKYQTVFQTTSTIEGVLDNDKDGFDLIKASFPGGSITGCPKIRAMQIIEELEPTARSVYTGAMGYMNLWGDMDFNILIRTLLLKKNKIYFHVGGGIVADSDPEEEYNETLVKAGAMQETLNRFFGR